MSPLAWCAFVAAAAIGAPLRYVVDNAVQDRTDGAFPWGTLVVNTSGSLLFGFLTGLALYHDLPDEAAIVLGAGFLGSYTTFSTVGFETIRLVEEGASAEAVRNVLGTLVAGALAAAAGLAVASL